MAIVTPIDRPKSVRNRCVIDVFGGAFVLCCFVEFSVGVGTEPEARGIFNPDNVYQTILPF